MLIRVAESRCDGVPSKLARLVAERPGVDVVVAATRMTFRSRSSRPSSSCVHARYLLVRNVVVIMAHLPAVGAGVRWFSADALLREERYLDAAKAPEDHVLLGA